MADRYASAGKPNYYAVAAITLPIWLVLIVTTIVGVYLYRSYQIVPKPAIAKNADAVTAIRDDLGLLDARQREIRDLLTLLLLVGGFYTALQGMFSYFTAQNFAKQAETELEKIKELMTDAQKRFPHFADIDAALEEALAKLETKLPRDWRGSGYDKLDVQTRQELFSLESFVALEFRQRRPEDGSHFLNLGRFYKSKYAGSKLRDTFDLDRAEYYLTLARENGEELARAYNELGLLYINFRVVEEESLEGKKPLLETARGHFGNSLKYSKNQQRAYYNLAWVMDELRDHKAAVDLLKQALTLQHWDETLTASRADLIQYNVGCACCRYAAALRASGAKTTEVAPWLDEAVRALELAAEAGGESNIEEDLQPDGELAILLDGAYMALFNDEYTAKAIAARDKFRAAATETP